MGPICKHCNVECIDMGAKGNYQIYICPKCGRKYKIKNL